MKVRKFVELLKKCDPEAIIKMHHRDGERLHYSEFYEDKKIIVFRTTSDPNPEVYPGFGTAGGETVKSFLKLFIEEDMDMDIVMHSPDGRPLLFVVSYENIPGVVVLEDADDNDLSSELEARFDNAAEEQIDELDFFLDLVDTGFTLDDIKENLPEKYEYSKAFMEEHGLI